MSGIYQLVDRQNVRHWFNPGDEPVALCGAECELSDGDVADAAECKVCEMQRWSLSNDPCRP